MLRRLRDPGNTRIPSGGHRHPAAARRMKTEPARPFVRHGFALALVGVAAVWGVTFPLVKESVTRVPPFEFLALRFSLAAIVCTLAFGRQVHALGRDGRRAGLL